MTSEFLDAFFGGTQAEVPDAWAGGDPYAVIQDPAANRIPVRLIHASSTRTVAPSSRASCRP